MEEKKLLSNETEITDDNFKKLMMCEKICKELPLIILKISICIFIIVASLILDLHRIDKIFCIIMALLGIKDTIEIKGKRVLETTLQYDFFENYFILDNKRIRLKVEYSEVNTIINTKDYYYFIAEKIPIVVAKDGFTTGTLKELEKLIKTQMKRRKK